MLKAFLLLFALLTAPLLFAQKNDFVEVTVQDTLQLDAEEIIYTVNSAEADLGATTMDSTTVESTKISRPSPVPNADPLYEVRQIIQAMHLDTLSDVSYTVSNNAYYRARNPVRIRFRSTVQLKEFTARVRKLEGIAGAITGLTSSKEKTYGNILAQLLFNQAKAKAEALAQIAGKKLGSVFSIKEEAAQGGWTMYPPLSAIPGWRTGTAAYNSGKITLHRQLVVQFNWQ